MNRRVILATQIERLLAFNGVQRPGVGLQLVDIFERHYGELPTPPKRGDLPDRAWVETLWKMAEEKRNTHSSFAAMCQYVLTCMDEHDREYSPRRKQSCTCVGTCKGSSGLGENWFCVLEQATGEQRNG